MAYSNTLRAALAALLCVISIFAHAGDDWAHKKKLAFDTTAEGGDIKESVAQLPLLVRLHSGNFAFAEAKPDGTDLRFLAADGKTPLKFHIEKFDASNELGVVWVQVPKLSGNAKTDTIVMEWGNPKAVAAGDAKGTYDATQIFDFHFSEPDANKDATGNANQARESGTRPVAAGPIGSAISFDGASRIVVPASTSLKLSGESGFTFNAWIKPAGNDNGKLYVQRDGAKSLSITLVGGVLTATADAATAKASAALKPGMWQQVAVVAGNGKLSFFIDGHEAGNGPFVVPYLAGEATLGEESRGELDEVALAGTPRAPDYIKALAVSQTADSPLLILADDAGGGESVSYFAILLGAVTVDGWVIIGILIVMGIISVAVMIGKTRYIMVTSKANGVFLEHFKKNSDALLQPGSQEAVALASASAVKQPSIYRLYTIGVHEMQHRYETQMRAGQPFSLSGPALDAIRASLDAAMVRVNQRLNSQIVLLTIAISGGPFLGLLGTVVGVMITFAAIAAAGDVNVNSIAPGIAAALVATVAGLGVAIPALFGYNWLAIQIKNVSADTQVFADEFLTKAAELHAR